MKMFSCGSSPFMATGWAEPFPFTSTSCFIPFGLDLLGVLAAEACRLVFMLDMLCLMMHLST
jgi:hypothetical protein